MEVARGPWPAAAPPHTATPADVFGEAVDLGYWQDRDVPRREWMVENCFLRGTVALVAGDGGIGKCLGEGTPILMYDGTIKPVEEIKGGDILMGPDSKPRRVREATTGTGPLFQVTPVKGAPYVVNSNHVLSLKWTPRTKRKRPSYPINIPIRDYLALPTQEKRHLLGWRSGCIEWPERAVDISPYLLGLWLGDGTAGFPEITSANPEVVEPALAEFAEGTPLRLVCRNTGHQGAARSYRLTGKKYHPNALTVALRQHGIFKQKAIPHCYLENSERMRLELLAGLLDTDGHLVSGCYEISQKSDVLAEQILFLARSLGFAAYDRVSLKKSQQSEPRPYHRIHISGDIDRIPVRIKKKKAAARNQKKRVLVTGITVDPIGEGRYYGFEVDGDHLFLLGDFTVTHNSLLMQQLCACATLGRSWLGLSVRGGRALMLACEDDRDELVRRQSSINRMLGCEFLDLQEAGMELRPRVGMNNTLMALERKDWKMRGTPLFERLVKHCRDRGIQYIVIDTATQTFGGNQNDEVQVTAFISELRRLAIAVQGVVILTKHPSMAGRSLGTGESGNVSWNNSSRSRWYMHKKNGQLVFAARKSNYGPSDLEIPIRWEAGSYVKVENEAAKPWYADN